MKEQKKPQSTNMAIFISFLLSLVFMGLVTIGISTGYIGFPEEGVLSSSSLGTPSKNCSDGDECLKNSPLDQSAVEQ